MRKIAIISTALMLAAFTACSDVPAQNGRTTEPDSNSSTTCSEVSVQDEEPECDDISSENDIEVIFTSGEFPHYEHVDELSDRADLVVRAEVLDNGNSEMRNVTATLPDPIPEDMLELFEAGFYTAEMFEPNYELFTVHRVRVLEVFSGNGEVGEIIEVLQRGGESETQRIVNEDRIDFAEGEDLVLFLLRDVDDGPTGLLTPWQAVYSVPDYVADDITESDAEFVLENIDERNEIVLTIGDLQDIFEDNQGEDDDNRQ